MASGTWLDGVQSGLAANLPATTWAANTPFSNASASNPDANDLPASPGYPGNTVAFYYATDTGVLYIWNVATQKWVAGSGGNNTPVDVKATYAIPVLGKQTLLLDAVAGFVATLPTATGSGNTVDVVVKTALTSGAYEVSVTSGDSIAGTLIANKGTTPTPYQAVGGTTHNVTLTNATVGAGIVGDKLTFVDIAANLWELVGFTWVTGTVATPFS